MKLRCTPPDGWGSYDLRSLKWSPTADNLCAKGGRQATPPVTIRVSLNLLNFQGELKPIIKDTFEFRTTRNGIKVVTKDTANYSALMRYFVASKIPYYTFHPKSLKSAKAVIRHLPGDTPIKDISDELLALGFTVINVRQMTATRPKAEGGLQT
jgi:hypothetical protein